MDMCSGCVFRLWDGINGFSGGGDKQGARVFRGMTAEFEN